MLPDHCWNMAMMWIIWIPLILIAVYLFRRDRYEGDKKERRESAIEVLKRRYASGEIAKEEFEERLKILRDSEF